MSLVTDSYKTIYDYIYFKVEVYDIHTIKSCCDRYRFSSSIWHNKYIIVDELMCYYFVSEKLHTVCFSNHYHYYSFEIIKHVP